jgi:hypothetical protein
VEYLSVYSQGMRLIPSAIGRRREGRYAGLTRAARRRQAGILAE